MSSNKLLAKMFLQVALSYC